MLRLLAVSMLLVAPACFAQSVYKCVDSQGTTVFSQTPCSDDPAGMQSVDTAQALKTATAVPEPLSERTKGAIALGGVERCISEQDAAIARANVELARIDRSMLEPGIDPVTLADLKVTRAEKAERAPAEAKEGFRACVEKIDEALRGSEPASGGKGPEKAN